MKRERVEREAEFHNKRFKGKDTREALDKYYVLLEKIEVYINEILKGKIQSKEKLLDYGCSIGDSSIFYSKFGAKVTGIDISTAAINQAIGRQDTQGIEFSVENAEATSFKDNHFDLIVGKGILHHLDLNNAYKELSRILNNDGVAIFLEPLGHNPFINLYRLITPSARSVDEHPLLIKDIELIDKYFRSVKVTYFNLFTLLSVPFRKFKFFQGMYHILSILDDKLIEALPFMKKYYWMVVIELMDPVRK
jgi:SAM-dependent methyltransferase